MKIIIYSDQRRCICAPGIAMTVSMQAQATGKRVEWLKSNYKKLKLNGKPTSK